LTLKPDHYYQKFPRWREEEKIKYEEEKRKREKTGDELADEFFSSLNRG